MIYFVTAIGIWLFFAIACTILAKLKELSCRDWFYRGLILGGFAFIFLLISVEEY